MANKLLKELERAAERDAELQDVPTSGLAEQFARELQRELSDDPELAEELHSTRAGLREWVEERIKAQTESDDMSRAVKRFIRTNLKPLDVIRAFGRKGS